jgi:multisubunit Na+/H+ antiporter MnhB subunit
MMIHLTGMLGVWIGLAALALAQDKHHRKAFGTPVGSRRSVWRAIGILALGLGFAAFSVGHDAAIGGIVWLGWCGLGVIAVTVALALLPANDPPHHVVADRRPTTTRSPPSERGLTLASQGNAKKNERS